MRENVVAREDEEEDDEAVRRNDEGEVVAQGEADDLDEATGYSYRLDRELDDAYDRYITNTKNKAVKSNSKMAKRSKKTMRLKASEQAREDEDMMMDDDTKKYAEMLQGPKESDDESSGDEEGGGASSDDDDGFHSAPVTPSEHKVKKQQKETIEQNPLIHRLAEESSSVKTARWFSNPLFENIGTTASFATMTGPKGSNGEANANIDDYDDDSEAVEELSSDEDVPQKSKKGKRKKQMKARDVDSDDEDAGPLTADSVLAMMPKTDKQIRHEKRLKANERKERKIARNARIAGEVEGGFEIVEGEEEELDNQKMENLSEPEKKKLMEARALIKAGMGAGTGEKESSGFEVVSAADTKKAGNLLPILDPREYNSENEDYDSDDYAETLALGTMMLRKSKAKSLVEEARARKNKRASSKLSAAKKKAETLANSSEMSEAMKLKAISKAMRGNDASRPSKTYVVSAKGGATRGGKGIKLVDKRMRNDKRGLERATKKKKNGKKGGMTGSKRRRNHS